MNKYYISYGDLFYLSILFYCFQNSNFNAFEIAFSKIKKKTNFRWFDGSNELRDKIVFNNLNTILF